ncbi:hypothetical protein J132_03904 [Termitomyces sp. J132]|nr:hypothetical protein J132_03904 [Termitomyces sp. J132]
MFAGRLRPINDIPWWLVSVAIAMFSISAADAIIELHFFVSLVYHRDPKAYLEFKGNFQWWSDVSLCLYVVQTWLGDSVLIYRCYMAWNKNIRMIVFSVITSLVGLAFGIAATAIGAGSTTYSNREKNLTPLIITFYAMAMGTNCITTSLIVSRISNDPLSRAIRITVEAGLIYSISLIVLLIIYLTHHNSQFGVQRVLVQIIAITFNLIIIHSERRYDNPRDSASFRRFSQTPVVITKDVVVSHDPPAPEDPLPSDENPRNMEEAGKIEEQRTSGSW